MVFAIVFFKFFNTFFVVNVSLFKKQKKIYFQNDDKTFFCCLFVFIVNNNIDLVLSNECGNYSDYEDTYRICQIFKDATIFSAYSSFWMSDLDICNWGASISYLECEYIEAINETRLVKMDMWFNDGDIHLEPASEYP